VSERFFAPCPRGLEAPLAVELAALGATISAQAEGGVGCTGPLELAYHANLESRLASRLLWQVGHGRYRDADELYALAKDVDWGRHFTAARTLRVDVTATRSPLQSLEFATLKVKDAVCDRFRADTGKRPSVDKERPDVRVHAYLTENEATLYLDTSGEALFKRGWRHDAAGAPLRENLAAGVLALAGWAPGMPLLDPMCGAGTIVIEAALTAAAIAPGLQRTFGFQKLAWFDGPTWQRIRQRARDRVAPGAVRSLDPCKRYRSPHAVAPVPPQPAANRRRRVVARHPGRPTHSCAARRRTSRPARGNPPYGVRLDDRDRLAVVLSEARTMR
jgi:putative N6-adenine-specific DNA methylase